MIDNLKTVYCLQQEKVRKLQRAGTLRFLLNLT